MSPRTIRITIEIDDDGVPTTTVEPPPALARAAAAIGAVSAGPAPEQPDVAAQLGEGLAGMSAGAAAAEEQA